MGHERAEVVKSLIGLAAVRCRRSWDGDCGGAHGRSAASAGGRSSGRRAHAIAVGAQAAARAVSRACTRPIPRARATRPRGAKTGAEHSAGPPPARLSPKSPGLIFFGNVEILEVCMSGEVLRFRRPREVRIGGMAHRGLSEALGGVEGEALAVVVVVLGVDGQFALRSVRGVGGIADFDVYARAGAVIDREKLGLLE